MNRYLDVQLENQENAVVHSAISGIHCSYKNHVSKNIAFGAKPLPYGIKKCMIQSLMQQKKEVGRELDVNADSTCSYGFGFPSEPIFPKSPTEEGM